MAEPQTGCLIAMDEEMTDSTPRYICCAADRTYGAGAIPPGMDQDAPGARTANPDHFGIEMIEELFPTARYHWRFPADGFIAPTAFTQGLADFYASIATKNCPASVLVRLKDAVLAHSILYADVSRVPTIVYETCRPNDRPAVRIIDREAIATADSQRFADGDWINLFVGSAGSANYGHWLVDDLPRLKAAQLLARTDPRPIRVLIHSYGVAIDRVRTESIRLVLGATTHIDLLTPDAPYRFNEIYYATPVTEHPVQKSPVAIDHAVRETVSAALTGNQDPGDQTLLFVTRSSRHGRTLANETEIRQLVEQRGFTTVDTEEMDFADQVRLFAGAQVVIGEMGAAMTNTLFCRPATTLIYLAPSGWIEPFYWDLAVVRGQYYRVLFGEVTDPLAPAHRSDFTVDPVALRDAINAL